MELISIVIPYSYLSNITQLTWKEILFGISEGLLSPASAIEHSLNELKFTKGEDCPHSLIELSWLSKGDTIHPFVDELAEIEPDQSLDYIRDKWLYLLLLWVLDNKEKYKDPLKLVEFIYVDFDYPESVKGFVRSAPADEINLGSIKKNEKRLFERWREFLDKDSKLYLLNSKILLGSE